MPLLLVVSGVVESNPGPGSDKKFQFKTLKISIRALHANLDEFAVAGSDYDVLVFSESKV